MRRLCILAAVLVASCGEEVTHRETMRFDQDVTLLTSISSAGGALGDETYRVSYRYRGEEVRFFEGTNPRDFAIGKVGDAVSIRFCDGNVRRAQPIFIAGRTDLIHLRLEMACRQPGS